MKQPRRLRWFLLAGAALLLACNTLSPILGATPTAPPTQAPPTVPPEPTVVIDPTDEATPEPGETPDADGWPPPAVDAPGGLVAGPVTDAERETAQTLFDAVYPPDDPVLLAETLGGVPGPIPEVAATAPPGWQEGDESDFWVLNNDSVEFSSVTMRLLAIGEHAYLWFDVDAPPVSEREAREAADHFDDIYERDREIFGEEPNPGIDGDPRVYILNTTSDRIGSGVAGYLDDVNARAVSQQQARSRKDASEPGVPISAFHSSG